MAVIEVAIGPGGVPGKFRVEVVDSPAGHLSAAAGLDVGALAGQRRLLQQEVLASAARARGVPETEERGGGPDMGYSHWPAPAQLRR
jgi:hypothetical protein